MAILLACGLECGLTGGQSTHWGGASVGAHTVETDIVRSGTYSMKCVTSAGGAMYRRAPKTAANRHWVARFYFYRVSGTVGAIFNDQSSSVPLLSIDGSGNFTARVGGGTIRTGPACAVDTWYRVDLHLDTSTGTKTLSWQIDGVAQTDATATVAAADLAEIRIGHVATSSTGTSYFDDFLIGDASADYPFGAGRVLGYIANRDGTHSFTLGDFKDETATNIAVASTTAYQKVDEAPPNTSDYISQEVQVGNYLEFGFTPSAGDAAGPRAVTVLAVVASSSGTANTQKLVLNDGGTIGDVYALQTTGGGPSEQSKTYATSPNTGIGWTKAGLDALLARWGYSTDFNPRPRLTRLSLEVEYSTTETSASAGQATGTGAAYGATTTVVGAAELASGSGAASAAQISTSVSAAVSSAAGTAYGAASAEAANASAVTATGTAYDAQVGDPASPVAGAATSSGAALAATTSVQASQGIASSTGSALAAMAAVKASTGLGSASGAAYAATTTAVASRRRAKAGRTNLTCTRTF